MTARFDLILRRVKPFGGQTVDIGLRDGRIAAIAERLAGVGPDYDGGERHIFPGIHDHHLHLFAAAAARASVDLSRCHGLDAVVRALRTKAEEQTELGWLRAIGFVEASDEIPDRHVLDGWVADRPIRIQDRTGALWLLNSAAVEQLGSGPYPPCVELDGGRPTGRIWRGDVWLRETLPSTVPSLRTLSQTLTAEGITSVTDAGATNGRDEASLFERAIQQGELSQRLTAMGTEELPQSRNFRRGPLKLLYNERDPVAPATLAVRIRSARAQGRNIAAHCVTLAELVFYLEALIQAGGARPGDRIEHGSVIPEGFIAQIAASGLIVVTQPEFVFSRGDRYAAAIDRKELGDLYRLRSLTTAAIQVRAGSDAPYGTISPWRAMAAACDRRTRAGVAIGPDEALSTAEAASLFGLDRRQRIWIGAAADLIVLAKPLQRAIGMTEPSPVDLTLIAGKMAFERRAAVETTGRRCAA